MNRFYVKYFVRKYFYTKFANRYMKFAADHIQSATQPEPWKSVLNRSHR